MIYCIIMVNWLIRLIITKNKNVSREVAQWDSKTEPLDSEPKILTTVPQVWEGNQGGNRILKLQMQLWIQLRTHRLWL